MEMYTILTKGKFTHAFTHTQRRIMLYEVGQLLMEIRSSIHIDD